MKRLKVTLIALGMCVLLLAGCAAPSVMPAEESKVAPTVVIEPSSIICLDSDSEVAILGSGFEPGQEIRVLISSLVGKTRPTTLSDIKEGLDPALIVADEFGVWGTRWTVGRYSKSRVAKPEAYILQVTDTSYNVLATTPFGFYDPEDPYEEWPSWAQAACEAP